MIVFDSFYFESVRELESINLGHQTYCLKQQICINNVSCLSIRVALFLKNKSQVDLVISNVDSFTKASDLSLNVNKHVVSELMHCSFLQHPCRFCNIPRYRYY